MGGGESRGEGEGGVGEDEVKVGAVLREGEYDREDMHGNI